MTVAVRQYHSATLVMDEDGTFLCSHAEAYIVPACCNGSPDECGRNTCGCNGQDGIVCPAVDCTGIQEWEIEDLYERLLA